MKAALLRHTKRLEVRFIAHSSSTQNSKGSRSLFLPFIFLTTVLACSTLRRLTNTFFSGSTAYSVIPYPTGGGCSSWTAP